MNNKQQTEYKLRTTLDLLKKTEEEVIGLLNTLEFVSDYNKELRITHAYIDSGNNNIDSTINLLKNMLPLFKQLAREDVRKENN